MGLPGRGGHDSDFVAYYAAHANQLRNTAYLLCGDWHLAEDLTQNAFTKLYQAWHRIERHDVLDQYTRRVLVRAFLDERRRPWRREHATVPGSADLDAVAPEQGRPDERLVLRTALAIARRTTARRNRLRVAGSGVAAVAVAGVLVTPAVAGWQAAPATDARPGTDTTAAQQAPVATPTTPSATPPPPPSAHAAPAHKMAAVLKGAVPPGYTITKVNGLKDDRTVYSRKIRLKPNGQLLSAYTQVEIASGGGQGQLMAVILYDGDKPPTGDLCATEHAGSKVEAALPCEVVTVNGVQIKVTREHHAEHGEVIAATRYLDGGALLVSSWQGIPEYTPDGNLPPDAVDTGPGGDEQHPLLAAPPLSAQQVAELAADPAMLP